MDKKWYHKKRWWLVILCFWPIILLWFASTYIWKLSWPKNQRLAAIIALWTLVFGSYVIVATASQNKIVTCRIPNKQAYETKRKDCDLAMRQWSHDNYANAINNPPTSTPTPQPTNTPKPVEKYNIVVTSQIVKHVDGKYRYFFDIRNKDTKPFEGSVSITLFTSELKNPLAGETFNTKAPIEPELGSSVYTDANTGPTSVHGANGMTKFKYVVKKGNVVVNSGEGQITDELEDVDAYGF